MDNAPWSLCRKGISVSTFAGLSVSGSLKLQIYKTKQNKSKKKKKEKKTQIQMYFGGKVCLDRVQDAPFWWLCAFYRVPINLLWHPPLISSPSEFVVPLGWSCLSGSMEEHPSCEGGWLRPALNSSPHSW